LIFPLTEGVPGYWAGGGSIPGAMFNTQPKIYSGERGRERERERG